jgi:O-methyltransferase involved in polyketide biosynthesis
MNGCAPSCGVIGGVTDDTKVELGGVQKTLFTTLAARAKEDRKKKPVLRDPKAAEMAASIGDEVTRFERGTGAWLNVLRTVIFDSWVRAFLAEHPDGTMRRRFFEDSDRRRMLAASVLDEDWMRTVKQSPGPYFFVSEGVLAYLADAPQALTRIAGEFPGELIAFDTFPERSVNQHRKVAEKKKIGASLAWSVENPRSLERLGLRLLESTAITRPPREVRDQLPTRFRFYRHPHYDSV